MDRLWSSAFLRFFVVNVLGIGLDIGLAFLLHAGISLPLSWSAAIGLLCAAGLTYVLHEFWTFREAGSRFSMIRLCQFAGSSLAVLAVRQAILWAMRDLLGMGESMALLQLVVAAACSFAINYGISRNFVFRSSRRVS